MTYLRLVPLASRSAAGVIGPVRARPRADREQPLPGRPRPREVVVYEDDAPLALELAHRVGRTARPRRPRREAKVARPRRARRRGAPWRRRAPGPARPADGRRRRRRRRGAAAAPTRRASASTSVRPVCRVLRRRSGDPDAAPRRRGRGPRSADPGRAGSAAWSRGHPASTIARSDSIAGVVGHLERGTAVPLGDAEDAMQLEAGPLDRLASSPDADAADEPREPLRRLALPRPRGGGCGSMTRPPARRPAGGGRRSTKRSPARAATSRSSSHERRHRAAVVELRHVLPAADDERVRLVGPDVEAGLGVPLRRPGIRADGRRRDAGGDSATRSRRVATGAPAAGRPAAASETSTWPRRRPLHAHRLRRRSATRPPAGPCSTSLSWTWIPRTRTSPPPGSTRRRSPTLDGLTSRSAGHDDAATAHPEHPIDREPRRAARRPWVRRARPRIAASASASASRPAPVCADTGSTGESRSDRRGEQAADASGRPRDTRSASGTRSVFVTTATPSRERQRVEERECSSVCARGPSSAATTSRQASISPAPTSMLPTRRSWPGHVDEVEGVTACGDEVRVADVDRQAASLLLGQAVGVDARQRAQEGGLAVVDVARGPDDPGHADAVASALPRAPRPRPRPAHRPSAGRRSGGRAGRRRPRCGRSTQGRRRGAAAPAGRRAVRGRAARPRAASRPAAHRRRPSSGPPRHRCRRRSPASWSASAIAARLRSAAGVGRDGAPDGDVGPGPARPDRARASRRPRRASPCRVASPARAGRGGSAPRGPRDRR